MIPLDLSIEEAFGVLRHLSLFVIGIAIYGVFVFKFYRFLAKKNLFKLDLSKYDKTRFSGVKKFFCFILYVAEYVLLFPLFSFFWFAVLTALLCFLIKNQPLSHILLVSISLVSAVRITAYYNEDLSKDLAKMLPFTLLGIFIIDISYFSINEAINILQQIPSMRKTLVYYLIFVILLEFILRIGYGMLSPFRSKGDKTSEEVLRD